MTNEYRRTLSDIDIIINEMEESQKNKIPAKLRKIIHENKLEDYKSNIRTDIPLEEQKIHPDTQAYLAMLYLNYWCEDENEKAELKKTLDENEKIYQKEIEEKYSIENIFKNRKEKQIIKEEPEEEINEETQIMPYKESFIKKILNKIFSFFRRK